jgi:hypothetical protein
MWDIDVNSVLDIPSAAKLPTVIGLIIWLVSCCWGGGIQKKKCWNGLKALLGSERQYLCPS